MIFRKLRARQTARRSPAGGEAERARRAEEALIDRLADALYRQDLREGGWVAEVGNVGPRVYRGEAAWILREVSLGTAQSGPPTP